MDLELSMQVPEPAREADVHTVMCAREACPNEYRWPRPAPCVHEIRAALADAGWVLGPASGLFYCSDRCRVWGV
jgi:hypothetical protein